VKSKKLIAAREWTPKASADFLTITMGHVVYCVEFGPPRFHSHAALVTSHRYSLVPGWRRETGRTRKAGTGTRGQDGSRTPEGRNTIRASSWVLGPNDL
jgi:hypothetical protein